MSNIKIIAQTDDYLVIDKPAGILVHKTERKDFVEETLVDWLLEKFPQVKEVGDDPDTRPGIVHRLDKDVSGLMVIALNQATFEFLKKQFQAKQVDKEYIALVHDIVQKLEGEINFSIQRKVSGGKMAARPDDVGREALTKFIVLGVKKKLTLLKVNIETGRTNQIRVHLNAYGHPIFGDFIYRPKKLKPRNGEKELGRIFLQAKKLSFLDKNGEIVKFEVPLDLILDSFYKSL